MLRSFLGMLRKIRERAVVVMYVTQFCDIKFQLYFDVKLIALISSVRFRARRCSRISPDGFVSLEMIAYSRPPFAEPQQGKQFSRGDIAIFLVKLISGTLSPTGFQ